MWSGDCTTTPEELLAAIEAARAAGSDRAVDVLAITDHGTINGAVELRGALAERGVTVIVGEEVRTPVGEIIGLGLTERVPGGLTPDEVCRRIHGQGGVTYVPHPFDDLRARLDEQVLTRLLDAGLIDAIEVLNAKTSLRAANLRAERFAVDAGLAMGAGSDAHVPAAVGSASVRVAACDPADLLERAGLLRALREGVVEGGHFDPPRPWTPRVVPSTRAL